VAHLRVVDSGRVQSLSWVRRPEVQTWWRRYQAFVWLILGSIFVAAFLYQSWPDLEQALPIVRQAEIRWILAAIACQLMIIALIGERFRLVFGWMAPLVPRISVVTAYLRRSALISVVPLGGPVGLYRFVRDLDSHDVPPPTTLYGSLLASVVNQIAFFLFVAPILGWMVLTGNASTAILISAAVMFGLIVLAGISVVMVMRPGRFQESLTEALPDRIAAGLISVREHRITLRNILQAMPHSLAIHAMGTVTLLFALWAVGVEPDLKTILMARVAATLAVILIPVWQGAGALELSVLGVLAAGGVSAPDALAAIAIFRFAQFWIPLCLGGIAFLPPIGITQVARVRVATVAGTVASAIAALFVAR
jgi:uncharacterized membrane protein YbhN (UPF0104 family)